jgi:hypothetical protein
MAEVPIGLSRRGPTQRREERKPYSLIFVFDYWLPWIRELNNVNIELPNSYYNHVVGLSRGVFVINDRGMLQPQNEVCV